MIAFLKVIFSGKKCLDSRPAGPNGSERSLLSESFLSGLRVRGLPWAGPCLACEGSQASSQAPWPASPHSESFH